MTRQRAGRMAFVAAMVAAPIGATAQTMAPPGQSGVLAGAPIHQETDLSASPDRVYRALLEGKQVDASGMTATVDTAVGGTFTIFSGHIIGRNLEAVPGLRLVQAWRVVDWPAGIWSIVRFELDARGTGTHLTFDQTGFPEGERTVLAAGWQSHYWAGLAAYLK